MSKSTKPESEKNPFAVALGKMGGKAGRDAVKKRGDSAYYSKLSREYWAKVKAEKNLSSPS